MVIQSAEMTTMQITVGS